MRSFLWLSRLIPFSVVIYTVAGGLKATFTSSYLHTVRVPVTPSDVVFECLVSRAAVVTDMPCQ